MRPLIGDGGAGPIVFSIVLVVLLLVALYNINVDELIGERGRLIAQARRRRIVGWVLAAAATMERLALFFVHSRVLNVAGAICWLLFLVFVTLSELRSVLKQRQVTTETISMAISVYLLLAVTLGISLHYYFPAAAGSFRESGLPDSSRVFDIQPIFPILGYYSLGTISTIGAGDIAPISLQARYATVAEAITGQFYLAILVARLVGIQMSGSSSERVDDATRPANARESVAEVRSSVS